MLGSAWLELKAAIQCDDNERPLKAHSLVNLQCPPRDYPRALRSFEDGYFLRPLNPSAVAAHGELLLIGTAVGGGAIGEIIVSTRKRPIPKITCAGGCLATIMMSVMWFADIASGQEANAMMNTSLISYGSLSLMTLTLLASAACIALSET